MFLDDHFSNSTADSSFCKNSCGMADFAKKLHRSTDLLTLIQYKDESGRWQISRHIIDNNFHARAMAQKHFFIIKNTFLSITKYTNEEAEKRSSLKSNDSYMGVAFVAPD